MSSLRYIWPLLWLPAYIRKSHFMVTVATVLKSKAWGCPKPMPGSYPPELSETAPVPPLFPAFDQTVQANTGVFFGSMRILPPAFGAPTKQARDAVRYPPFPHNPPRIRRSFVTPAGNVELSKGGGPVTGSVVAQTRRCYTGCAPYLERIKAGIRAGACVGTSIACYPPGVRPYARRTM